MKMLISILGPGASGKSTLSRAILHHGVIPSEDGDTGITETLTVVPATVHGVAGEEKVKYVISSQNGIALAGNYKNGTDSIKSIDALPCVLELCWVQVPAVIVDPVRSSMKFVNWMTAYPEPLGALFVYLDVSEETNVKRLLERRNRNAEKIDPIVIPETQLPEKTHKNMLAFRDRARGVWEYAQANYKRFPNSFLTLPETYSPAQSAELIHRALKSYRPPLTAKS